MIRVHLGVDLGGTAIGTAFSIKGVPYRGSKGLAGELGYLPIYSDGSFKNLMDVAGGQAIIDRLKRSPEEINQSLQRGEGNRWRQLKSQEHLLVKLPQE